MTLLLAPLPFPSLRRWESILLTRLLIATMGPSDAEGLRKTTLTWWFCIVRTMSLGIGKRLLFESALALDRTWVPLGSSCTMESVATDPL